MVNENNRTAYYLEVSCEFQENCDQMPSTYGDNCMSCAVVFMWHKRFSKGWEAVKKR